MSKNYMLIGAGSLIGTNVANLLLEQGHSVDAIGREKKELPDSVEFHQVDVCQNDNAFPIIEKNYDGLVYFPGTINLKPFKQLTAEDFQKDLDVNYLGAVKAIQYFLPQLQSANNASIVLISSVAATVGMPFHTSVGAAKAAVTGFALALAAELAPKIRVNIVAPSLSETPLASALLSTDDKKEHAAKRHPLQAIGEAQDISAAIDFLLSEKSKWITGQTIHVDGGLSSLRIL